MKHAVRIAIAALLMCSIAGVRADEACLKRVFNRFCLGGDVNLVLRQGAQPAVRQADGERLALVFMDGRARLYVLAFRGRVYKVVRGYRSATQLRYEELYALLRKKYGEGEDHSRFPSYADTSGRKVSAIRRGDGQANYRWEPAESWSVELSWTRELGLAVSYIANALDSKQREALESGY